MGLPFYDLLVMLSVGVLLITAMALSFILFPYYFGGPWVPSDMEDVHAMLELAEVQAGELVVDLGAGDGRTLIAAAQLYGARALGIEISPLRCALIWLKARALGLHGLVEIRLGNLYHADLSQADVVLIFLMPGAVDKLQTKLLLELGPGARVVSNSYPIGDWSFVRRRGYLYLYQISAERPLPGRYLASKRCVGLGPHHRPQG